MSGENVFTAPSELENSVLRGSHHLTPLHNPRPKASQQAGRERGQVAQEVARKLELRTETGGGRRSQHGATARFSFSSVSHGVEQVSEITVDIPGARFWTLRCVVWSKGVPTSGPWTAELDRTEHRAQDADSDPRPHYTDEETGPAGVNGLPQATRGRVWAQEVRLRNFYS